MMRPAQRARRSGGTTSRAVEEQRELGSFLLGQPRQVSMAQHLRCTVTAGGKDGIVGGLAGVRLSASTALRGCRAAVCGGSPPGLSG